jgi:hypothetical protein
LVYGQYRLAAVWALTRRVSPSTRPRREIYGAHPIPVELLLERVTYIYVSVTTAILLGALGYLLGRQADRLEALSETDALTGLANRRAFRRRLADDLRRARRYGSPVSLLLVDVASISRAHLIRALRWADYGVIAAREYPYGTTLNIRFTIVQSRVAPSELSPNTTETFAGCASRPTIKNSTGCSGK